MWDRIQIFWPDIYKKLIETKCSIHKDSPWVWADSAINRWFSFVRQTSGTWIILCLVKSINDKIYIETTKTHRLIVILPKSTVILHTAVVGVAPGISFENRLRRSRKIYDKICNRQLCFCPHYIWFFSWLVTQFLHQFYFSAAK